MITSLNVNQFLKKQDWRKLRGQNLEKVKIWREIEDYYYKFITDHLREPEDIVVLQEVPYKIDKEYISCGEIKYRKSIYLSLVYVDIEVFCAYNGYELIIPVDNDAFFITVAIFKNGAYKKLANTVEKTFSNYGNRIVALEGVADNSNEIIVGLHIPANCREFWENLIALHEKLPQDKKIIYVGDFNTYSPDTENKIMFDKFLLRGIVDVWVEKGNPNTKSTFVGNTRIDYVLMTAKDFYKGKYEIKIDDSIRDNGYSDHSAIMLLENNQ